MADYPGTGGWTIDPLTGKLVQRVPTSMPASVAAGDPWEALTNGSLAGQGFQMPAQTTPVAPSPQAAAAPPPAAPAPQMGGLTPWDGYRAAPPAPAPAPPQPSAPAPMANAPPSAGPPQNGPQPFSGLPGAAPGDTNVGMPPVASPMPPATPVSAPAVPPGAPDVNRYSAMLPNIAAAEGKGNGILDGTWNDFKASDANKQRGYTDADRAKPAAVQAASLWNLSRNDGFLKTTLGRPVTDGELASSWLLGPSGAAAFIKNPSANSYELYSQVAGKTLADKAFAQNGDWLAKGDTAGQTLGKLNQLYHIGTPGTPGAPDAAPAAVTATANDTPAAPAQGQPGQPNNVNSLLARYGIQPASATDEGLALASGLLSGPTFGAGLGKGLAQLANLRQQERATGLQAAHLDATLQGLGITAGYRKAQEGHMGDQDAVAGEKLVIAHQNADTSAHNAGTRAAGVENQGKRLDAQLSGGMAQGAVMGKSAGEDLKNLQDTVEEDRAAMQDTVAARQMVQSHPELLGTTVSAQLSRVLTNAGIIGDPNDLSVFAKATTAQRNEMLKEVSNGHVGAFRSNAEVNNLGNALANASTNPKAADWLLQTAQQMLAAKQQWRDQVGEFQSSNPNAVTGGRYFGTKSQFMQDYFRQHPLPTYEGGGSGPPASAQNGAPWTHTTSGGFTFTVAPPQ